MYIVAIAWLYVALMMSITERSVVAGVLTFVFYGLAPCALVLWLFGGPVRAATRRQREAERARQQALSEEREAEDATESMRVADEHVHEPDRKNTEPDQR
jgi:hypothetical protein